MPNGVKASDLGWIAQHLKKVLNAFRSGHLLGAEIVRSKGETQLVMLTFCPERIPCIEIPFFEEGPSGNYSMYTTPPKAISPKQRRLLLARAKTLNKKAEELMSELLALVGAEHASTDYADNVIVATEELVDVISNAGYDMWNPATPSKDRSKV